MKTTQLLRLQMPLRLLFLASLFKIGRTLYTTAEKCLEILLLPTNIYRLRLREWRPNAASSMAAKAGVMAAKIGKKRSNKKAKSERAIKSTSRRFRLAGNTPPHTLRDW